MMDIIIKQPETAEEFKQYLDLRWRVLRAPWGEPKGSEIDDIEDRCFHVMATVNKQVAGVGRLQYNSNIEAQIRYMAVDQAYEGKRIGRMIVNALEQEARNRNISSIVLDAREPVVGFYKKLGYSIEKKSYLLFDEIQHFRMRKRLTNQKQA
ncbi:MAG: GNAT family N-acetyltransferase [Gammaproteobacteria bacterium]|jgi:predicted GNAT family N-acyltransferase